MKVAAAQIKVSDSKQDNLQRMLNYIKKAKNSDVICFPELSLQSDNENVKPVGKDLAKLSAAAKKYNLNLIFGAYVKVKNKIKNMIFVINRQGKIAHQYSKRHPYASEESYLSKGRKNKPFVLDGVKCAVINCWDYAFPEDGRKLASQGAQVFFCPAYLLSHPKTKNVLDNIPQVRAFDYMSYFIMVDAVAKETFKRSKICHPLKKIKSIKDKEGLITAELDLSEINDLRKQFKNFKEKQLINKHESVLEHK